MVKIFKMGQKIIAGLTAWQLSCILCHSNGQAPICQLCERSLNKINRSTSCYRCLASRSSNHLLCSDCLTNPIYFTRVIAGYKYATPLTNLVAALKYQGRIDYSSALSYLLLKGITPELHELPAAIIPVPLHPQKQKSRGFNQVHELIRGICATYPQLRLIQALRIRLTPAQVSLTRSARSHNLAGAFYCPTNLTNLKVALIDDVVTTATTCNELAKACLSAGAKEVEVWCLMRAQE
jgi:ComF family protein